MARNRLAVLPGLAMLWLVMPGCDLQNIFAPAKSPTLLAVGSPMPKLEAAGWIGSSPPTAEELAGSVVVLHCFASW